MHDKRNFKQEIKDLWKEHEGKVKVGAICLLVGGVYGFAKGIDTQGKLMGESIKTLVDKMPKIPDISYEDALNSIPKEDFLRYIDQLDQ